MPKSWVLPETPSPFVELITEYMWSHRPPMSVATFAYQTGIAKTAVWGWIREQRKPHPTTLDRLAERTGIPRDKLYAACGYSLPSEPEEQGGDPFADLIGRVQRDPLFSPVVKRMLIERIEVVARGEEGAERERLRAQGNERDPFADMTTRIVRDPRLSLPAKLALVDSILRVTSSLPEAERQRLTAQQHQAAASPKAARRMKSDSQIDSQDSQIGGTKTDLDATV